MAEASGFVNLGPCERITEDSGEFVVELESYRDGVHEAGGFFFHLHQGTVKWVVSTECDHAGGTLVKTDDCTATCPFHGWRLDFNSLEYSNIGQPKPRCEDFRVEGAQLFLPRKRSHLAWPKAWERALPETATLQMRFLAHASFEINVSGTTIVTDPWLQGPCFTTGWWHSYEPKADAIERLQKADIVYVSHNHPDHMHEESLQHLAIDALIITPDFQSGSTVKLFKRWGFTNVHALTCGNAYSIDGGKTILSILKSGDFRDDSGLWVQSGDLSALLTVDASALNHFVLPRNVGILGTSFAGGASGFPWCFDHLDEQSKPAIGKRHRTSLLNMVKRYAKETQPRVYVPYAGYFTEAAERDSYIKENNEKNTHDEVRQLIAEVVPEALFVDPRKDDVIELGSERVDLHQVEAPKAFEVHEAYIANYLDEWRQATISDEEVTKYFAESGFQDKMVLTLVLTDDDFQRKFQAYRVDFTGPTPTTSVLDVSTVSSAEPKEFDGLRHLQVCVRKGECSRVLKERKPWEDLVIGFQCRIKRTPDIYNSQFWFHFSNVYVGEAKPVQQ